MENNEPKLPSGQIVKWLEKDHPAVYANLVAFSMTSFDITVIFGEVQHATATEVIGLPRARVLLSPEQANNLFLLLGVAIGSYVSNNGPLRTSGAVNVAELKTQVEAQRIKFD